MTKSIKKKFAIELPCTNSLGAEFTPNHLTEEEATEALRQAYQTIAKEKWRDKMKKRIKKKFAITRKIDRESKKKSIIVIRHEEKRNKMKSLGYVEVGLIIVDTKAIAAMWTPEELIEKKRARKLWQLAKDEVEDYISNNKARYEPVGYDDYDINSASAAVYELFEEKIELHRASKKR